MKKSALTLAVLLGLAVAACSGNGTSSTTNAPAAAETATGDATPSLNIRYIDADSLTSRYNLAIDFREVSIRAFSKLENARQSRAAEIQRFGSQIEDKMRSNGYLSEASYNADVAKFNKMQQDAQAYLDNLQRTTEQELAAQQQQLNDSIESFIQTYNATKGYDAILFKASGVYFNPALDITDEVIEGLNARYNRVNESK